jgi:hypothetical protein
MEQPLNSDFERFNAPMHRFESARAAKCCAGKILDFFTSNRNGKPDKLAFLLGARRQP